MKRTKRPSAPLAMIGLGLALMAGLTGCVGYVDGGYVGPVVVAEPEVYFYGGFDERGRDVHDYGRRGFESRGAAHPAIRGPAIRLPLPPPPHFGGGRPKERR